MSEDTQPDDSKLENQDNNKIVVVEEKGGIMNTIMKHKFIILGVIIVIIILVWFFCFRKKSKVEPSNDESGDTSVEVESVEIPQISKIKNTNVTKIRPVGQEIYGAAK